MTIMRRWLLGAAFVAVSGTAMHALADPGGPAARAAPAGREWLDRGRYLVRIAGCNDCHTAGYAMSGGNVPEERWLTGDHIGWRGPWGTTYPINLRLYMDSLTEDQWLAIARTKETRPPMPWFSLRAMSTDDLRAIYRFTKSLGPAGDPAPEFVPPNEEPDGPYVQFPAPPR